MQTTVKCNVEVRHVREVSLRGSANLQFWTDFLRDRDLRPAEKDGRAQLLIIAADARWMGLRFRELSFSVFVSAREDGSSEDGVYLIQAFNSSRFFSFVERTIFRTPYDHGSVQVKVSLPCSIGVTTDEGTIFEARMSSGSSLSRRASARDEEEQWHGPIFLPPMKPEAPERVFFGKIRGCTQAYPFSSSDDEVTLKPPPGCPALEWLAESQLTLEEWRVRGDATHARSKTVKRERIRFP